MTASRASGTRTLLLGTDAPFSAAVFSGLISAGIEVVAVGVDGDHPFAPLFSASTHGHRETLPSLATARGLPMRSLTDVETTDAHDWVADQAPDFLLVACFSRRLPASICAQATRDCLNLHPSLLPRYRGPAPYFWQLRAGEEKSGITLHRVSPELDAGPIVGQRPVHFGGGVDGATLEERCAQAGVGLYLEMLEGQPEGRPVAVPQVEAEASYLPSPMAEDFRIDTGWSAQRVFDFMRGTRHWNQPYRVAVADQDFLLREALAFDPESTLGVPFARLGDTLDLQCNPGVLQARLA